MADEDANSEVTGTVNERDMDSAQATIDSSVQGGTESTCNNNAPRSEEPVDDESQKSLQDAEELMTKGEQASKEKDYSEAAECFSRALEIRVSHYGELAPECVMTYYKYGCALLYKAQEEADPLVSVPKKEGESQRNSRKDEPAKSAISAESSAASVANSSEEGGTIMQNGKENDNAAKLKDEEEEEEEDESEAEDTAEGDEDESDLDLAWKMLDVARAIVEKQSGATFEKVDILSALAEVALEREDVETSLNDYLKALSMLEQLVEPDSRHIAELNFRICLCLEIGSKPKEAMPYCEKAISVCKSRVQRLTEEVKGLSEQAGSSEHTSAKSSSSSPQDFKEEIETLNGLCSELEKKLEELEQLVSNPRSILQEILGLVSANARGAEKSSPSAAMSSSQVGTINRSGDFDSPTVSTAHTNGAAGVTDLGVVGRGVKRVHLNPSTSESNPVKRPSVAPSNNGNDSTS